MATSPLFGWEEPDDTDLVKDGAAAIRTLGNAIDTSLGDLLGGTSGQVLSKNSNTNMDFTWVDTDDANAIQNAIVDAKGDLIAASAADTPARLPVVAYKGVLMPDSTAATGLKWGGEWTSYAVTWTATTTNPSLGNGALNGLYAQIGNITYFNIILSMGSTTTYGSGDYIFSLPFTANGSSTISGFPVNVLKQGVGYNTAFTGNGYVGNNVSSFKMYTATQSLGQGVPFTFAQDDQITVKGWYSVDV